MMMIWLHAQRSKSTQHTGSEQHNTVCTAHVRSPFGAHCAAAQMRQWRRKEGEGQLGPALMRSLAAYHSLLCAFAADSVSFVADLVSAAAALLRLSAAVCDGESSAAAAEGHCIPSHKVLVVRPGPAHPPARRCSCALGVQRDMHWS